MAYLEGRPVAASANLLYKKYLYGWYLGLERIRSLSPAEYLTWYEVEWAKKHSFELYDFGGAGWPHKPYGVRDFKAKFGGQLVHYGRYRKIYSPWRYFLAERAYNLARSALNPVHWIWPKPGLGPHTRVLPGPNPSKR